ncbi:MAG: hypothetical protein EBR67_06985 [Proteobacteria bacterium]|nr:hypothetical protein [Pseudomonadota bacterium]
MNFYVSVPKSGPIYLLVNNSAEQSIPPEEKFVPRYGAGDSHGVKAGKIYWGQALLRESINQNKQERLRELTKIMIQKVIKNEIPIISLMANGINSDQIKEYLVVQSTTSQSNVQSTTSQPKTLTGDRNSVFFNIGSDGDLSTLYTLNTNQVQDYWENTVKRKVNAFVSNDYSPFNAQKSENYIMGHNHPDGSEPSNTDLRVGGVALSLVLTQNSVYFIDYTSKPQDLDKLQASFMEYNKALTSACLETQQEANSGKIGDKQQESNSRIQYASRLLSCNIKTYQGNFEDDPLRPFNLLQVKLINQSLDLSKRNPLLQAIMEKILSTPEALQILGNALELYSSDELYPEAMPNKSESDFEKILKEALVEVFNAQAIFQIDRLNSNPKAINSEILTNLPEPRELAAAVVSGDINSFLSRSTFLDLHSELRCRHETDAAYYYSLKENFGISVARIPLKEILDEEDYKQFQYIKAEFVRALVLDDSYSEYNKAREFWINSFVPLNIKEGTKAMSFFSENDLENYSELAEKTVKVLGADDVEGFRTTYQNLDSDRKKLFFLSALWKESHPIVNKLNEVVSNEDLNRFNNDLHELCLRDCVKGYIKTFGERLDFDISHLGQIYYIANRYEEEGYAADLVDAIGKSLKKKGTQIDKNLYEFFTSDRITNEYKEKLAALLPLQERGNEYCAKLFLQASTNKNVPFKLKQILQGKLEPFTLSKTPLNNAFTNEASSTNQASFNSDDRLLEVISDFKIIATSTQAINRETIKKLAILAPQYLLTEFPSRFILETNNKERYSSDLVARLRGIDPIHFKTDDFRLIKTAFLEYLNTNKAKYEADIERFKNNSVLEGMMRTKLNKTINQINFFENPTNS